MQVPAEGFPDVCYTYASLTYAIRMLTYAIRMQVPAEGFSDYARQLWESIESDRDLDLPSQRKMLSMVRVMPP